MTKKILDIMALVREVDRCSKSGEITAELLAKGNILYGADPLYPGYIKKLSPSG